MIGARVGAQARAGSWWQQRPLRTRLVVLSIVPLTVALVAGTVTLVLLFTAGRIRDLDRQTHREADTLDGLTRTEQLTTPLPVPPGSPLLAQVLSTSGTVLAASPSASLILPLVQPDAANLQRRDTNDEDNPYGAAALRVHEQPGRLGTQPVLIVVAAPLADVRRALQSLRIVLFLLVPALVAVASILEWVVIGLTLRPVERLRAAATTLAAEPDAAGSRVIAAPADAGGTDRLLPVGPGDDEITRLGRTLNELLRRLHHAIGQQRRFLVDAAHELRSPLASMRVQLDIARTHPTLLTSTELAAELTAEVDRLTRLANDLLLLGRLDAGARAEPAAVNLTELAAADGPAVHVMADHDDLGRLIRNLTDNAHRHADTVRTTVSQDGDRAILDVDDDGPGIAPTDRARAFERWTRLDAARDRETGGSGLGLAIAREIAHAHSGDISIQDSPLGGTRVRLRLPVAARSSGPPGES